MWPTNDTTDDQLPLISVKSLAASAKHAGNEVELESSNKEMKSMATRSQYDPGQGNSLAQSHTPDGS